MDCQRSYTINKYGSYNVNDENNEPTCKILYIHVLLFYHHKHHAHVKRKLEKNEKWKLYM